MGKEDPCEVCGGTETKLVDGFYYCVECGTQDTKVQETIVETQWLEDGGLHVSSRTKYSIKIQDGVEMSPEWYKWHKLNFMLAGLTEQLIELGAAPSLRMKVLWLWTRYVRKHQKKDEIDSTKMLNQLEEASSSSDSDGLETEVLHEGSQKSEKRRYLLLTLLALGLAHDSSPFQVSHLTRLVMSRLLPVNDAQRYVPAALLGKKIGNSRGGLLTTCYQLRQQMTLLSRRLALNPAPAPDVEALLAAQLVELRLPNQLAELVRALQVLAPLPWRATRYNRECWRYPSYEITVMAYILVALKLCFGLDDDYEVRLSDAVDAINAERDHPRASDGEPAPTDRLFSFREWSEHLQLRKLLLGRMYAPLAWRRNARTTDEALLEHFEEMTTVWAPRRNKNSKVELSDQVTMDILDRIPVAGGGQAPAPLAELRPAAAARAPQLALARLLAPRLPPAPRARLREDFTQYSLQYAARSLTLPPSMPLRGVSAAGKEFRADLKRDVVLNGDADATPVLVKDCWNRNWTRTKRPTARHVVLGDDSGDEWDPRPAPLEPDRELETFQEEDEGRSVFDDDFFDIKIKEEKLEAPPSPPADFPDCFNETKDEMTWADFSADFESTRRPSVAGGTSPGPSATSPEPCATAGGVFDSGDEDDGPAFDPATFNRENTIKELMVAMYNKYKIHSRYWPRRYRFEAPPKEKKNTKPRTDANRHKPIEERVHRDPREALLNIGKIVLAYKSGLPQASVRRSELDTMETLRYSPELPEPLEVPESLESTEPLEPPESVEPPERASSPDALVADARDSNSDSWDGPAYDPVYSGAAPFDPATHDPAQLFLRLPAAPPAPAPHLHLDDDVIRILDEKSRLAKVKAVNKNTSIDAKEHIDHLIDDPDGVTEFNYWFKHYPLVYITTPFINDLEIEKLPASFRFVLLEGAAALGAAPGELYYRMCDVERGLLRHLPRQKYEKKETGRGKSRSRWGFNSGLGPLPADASAREQMPECIRYKRTRDRENWLKKQQKAASEPQVEMPEEIKRKRKRDRDNWLKKQQKAAARASDGMPEWIRCKRKRERDRWLKKQQTAATTPSEPQVEMPEEIKRKRKRDRDRWLKRQQIAAASPSEPQMEVPEWLKHKRKRDRDRWVRRQLADAAEESEAPSDDASVSQEKMPKSPNSESQEENSVKIPSSKTTKTSNSRKRKNETSGSRKTPKIKKARSQKKTDTSESDDSSNSEECVSEDSSVSEEESSEDEDSSEETVPRDTPVRRSGRWRPANFAGSR